MTTATATQMTVDEFLAKHVHDSGLELVRGQIVRYDMPGGKHGKVCMKVGRFIDEVVEANRLGQVFCNDTFFVLSRNPDTVRGPDVAFWSFARHPADAPVPEGAFATPPDLAIEVRSPSDRLTDTMAKALDYLNAGVTVVLLLDPTVGSVAVLRNDDLPQRLHNGDELTLPDVLPGFALPVRRLFE